MADRIPLPTPGPVDLNNWARPLTQAVNEHDTVIGRILTGVESVSFASASSHTRTINFGITFPGVPKVTIHINSSAGSTAQWHIRPYNVTVTSFDIFAFSGDAGADVWSSIPCGWIAIYQP